MDSKVLTKTWTRFNMIWIILTVLVASTKASWWSWLWAEETIPAIHPCIQPISHVYSANETLSAWKSYMVKEKINIDAMSDKAIGSFLLFIHETYAPCVVKEMEKVYNKDDDWKKYLKGLIGSEAFIFSSPGTLALIVILVQCMQNRCCKKGDYKLLRKRQARSHLMR